MTSNGSLSSSQDSQLSPTPHCSKAEDAVFAVPGMGAPPGSLLVKAKDPEIVTVDQSCDSTADAHAVFETSVKDIGGSSVPGIGNEANLVDLSSKTERAYFVGWRQDNQVGIIVVVGAPNDARIGPKLAELLGRRAVARS